MLIVDPHKITIDEVIDRCNMIVAASPSTC